MSGPAVRKEIDGIVIVGSSGYAVSPLEAIKYAEKIITLAKQCASERLATIKKEEQNLILAAYYDPKEGTFNG